MTWQHWRRWEQLREPIHWQSNLDLFCGTTAKNGLPERPLDAGCHHVYPLSTVSIHPMTANMGLIGWMNVVMVHLLNLGGLQTWVPNTLAIWSGNRAYDDYDWGWSLDVLSFFATCLAYSGIHLNFFRKMMSFVWHVSLHMSRCQKARRSIRRGQKLFRTCPERSFL